MNRQIESSDTKRDCLSEQQLAWIVESGESDQHVESHLASCPTCRDSLDRIAASGDTWAATEAALRRLAEPNATSPVETLQRSDSVSDTGIPSGTKPGGETERRAKRDVQIEGYELVDVLGRGGTGTVFRARDLRLSRWVAIKILDSIEPEHAVRFRSEAEATAKIQHPGIISIYGFGVANEVPYLVMEWIPGGDLASRLNGRPLPHRDAARLIRDVAQAISAAHQDGILHRDLKPANLLIREQDGEDLGPVVSDFGLAHWTQTATGPTQTGHLIGTPAYMPPEQALARPGWATPAVDLYALGAVLYQCLTGRPPHQAETTAATIESVIHSDIITPRSLNPSVPRKLQTICMKCLQHHPSHRYAMVSELSDDLERFLQGRPVHAQPPALIQRVSHWVARHPVSVGVGAVSMTFIFVLLLTWLRFTQQLTQKTELAQRRAEQVLMALDQADQSAKATNEVLRFLTEDLVGAAHPELEGPNLTVVDALQLASERIEGRFEEEPLSEAAVRTTIGSLFLDLGHPDASFPHLQQSHAIIDSLPLDEFRFDTHLALIQCLLDLGRSIEATSMIESLRSKCQYAEGWAPDQERQFRLKHLAIDVTSPNDSSDRLADLESLLSDCGKALGESNETWLSIHSDIGTALFRSGQQELAAIHLADNLARTEEALGHDHPDTLGSRQNAAFMMVKLNRFDEAEAMHRQNHVAKKRVFGIQHPSTIGTRSDIAMLLWRQGKHAEAIELLQKVTDQRIEVLGVRHASTLSSLYQISRMFLDQERIGDAIVFLGPRLESMWDSPPTEGDWISTAITYSRIVHHAGSPEQAMTILKQAESVLQKERPDDRGRKLMLNRAWKQIRTSSD
ncbi:MAG: serine/threonine-protein kinase [Planctomycetota bacterium]